MTTASPMSRMPVGSRSSVMAPVVLLNAVMLKLANGVAPLGRAIAERMRPVGSNVPVGSTIHAQMTVLVAKPVTPIPATPECTSSFAFTRTRLT